MLATSNNIYCVALESQGRPVLNGGSIVRGSMLFRAIGSIFLYIRDSTEEFVFTYGPLQQPLTVQVNGSSVC